MARMVKNTTIRHNEMVGEDELLLRRVGLSIPEFYRLTPYQMTQVKGYVDTSYTKVILLDGTIIPTRDAMARLHKHKPVKSVAGLYGDITHTAINLSSVISTKTTYSGEYIHQVTCTWYHQATGGKITVKIDDEYIVDCYAFCDHRGSWEELLKFVEAFMLLMVHSQCNTVDKYGDVPDRIDQLKRLFFKNQVLSLIRELGEEVEIMAMPNAIEKVLVELDGLSFTDDDDLTPDELDIRTLLTMVKLINAVYKFTVEITRPLWDMIETRYVGKPYMHKFIKEIFYHRRALSNMMNYRKLIEYHAKNLRIGDIESDLILGYSLFDKLKFGSTDPVYLKASLLRRLPDNHQARRILKSLKLMNVVIKP